KGAVGVIGSDGTPYSWDTGAKAWKKGSGGGKRIAVDPAGNPWVVNDARQIWQFTAGAWKQHAGAAHDIAISPDGSVYIVSTTPTTGGFQVQSWNGSAWVNVSGAAGTRVAAGPAETLYVTR